MKAGHVLLFSNKEGGGKKKKDEKKARDLKKQNYFSNRIGEKKKPENPNMPYHSGEQALCKCVGL